MEPINDSPYEISNRWSQIGQKLIFEAFDSEIYFEMPIGWHIKNTHEDLFRIAHYFLCSPWEKGILDGWLPNPTERLAMWIGIQHRCRFNCVYGTPSTENCPDVPPKGWF
jgi:hypothetical protein